MIAKNQRRHLLLIAVIATITQNCKDVSGELTEKMFQKPEAVMKIVRAARYELQAAMFVFNQESGLLSDEFMNPSVAGKIVGYFDPSTALDSRYLPDISSGGSAQMAGVSGIESYGSLQRVRGTSRLARLMLINYVEDNTAQLQAELLLYEAAAEIMLADMYCSGIPLSIISINSDYTYRPGSRTDDVYKNALALLDSVMQLGGGNDSLSTAARILSARAALNLGEYDRAHSFVSDIDPAFDLSLSIIRTGATRSNPNGFIWNATARKSNVNAVRIHPYGGWSEFAVANLKGGMGLTFITPRDPRIALDSINFTPDADRVPLFMIYFPKERAALTITNGIEARLIMAEVMARRGDETYLTVLNNLRTDGTFSLSGTDTLYNAGEGFVLGLAPLVDPVPAQGQTVTDARVDLVIKERAFWLFFMGRRQADLRRLIRNDFRPIASVYPVGTYPAGVGAYDNYVDVPIPMTERFNPHFAGSCIWRDG